MKHGDSERFKIKDTILQGSALGPLQAIVSLNEIGEKALENPQDIYFYRGIIPTPPLQQIDDLITIKKCQNKSNYLNKMVNGIVEEKS